MSARLQAAKNQRPPKLISGGRHYVIRHMNVLFLVLIEQSSLMKVLTTNTVTGPRHRIESLIRQGLAAMHTLGIFAAFDSLQRFINQIQ